MGRRNVHTACGRPRQVCIRDRVTSSAAVNLALLTYNKTRAIDNRIVNYRTFIYEITPAQQWLDPLTQTAYVLMRAANPQNFLRTDKVQFITGDGDVVITIPVNDDTGLAAVDAGITHTYRLPGKYTTQCIVLDKNDAKSNLGSMPPP